MIRRALILFSISLLSSCDSKTHEFEEVDIVYCENACISYMLDDYYTDPSTIRQNTSFPNLIQFCENIVKDKICIRTPPGYDKSPSYLHMIGTTIFGTIER